MNLWDEEDEAPESTQEEANDSQEEDVGSGDVGKDD